MYILNKNVDIKIYKKHDFRQNVIFKTMSKRDILTTSVILPIMSLVKNSENRSDKNKTCNVTSDVTCKNTTYKISKLFFILNLIKHDYFGLNLIRFLTSDLISKILNFIKMSKQDKVTKLPLIYINIYYGGIKTPHIYFYIYSCHSCHAPEKKSKKIFSENKSEKKFGIWLLSIFESLTGRQIITGGHYAV